VAFPPGKGKMEQVRKQSSLGRFYTKNRTTHLPRQARNKPNAFAKTASGQTHIGKITPKTTAAPFFLVDHRRPSGDPSNRPQRSAQILAGDSGAGNASSFFGAVFKYSNRCFLSRQARDEHGETLREIKCDAFCYIVQVAARMQHDVTLQVKNGLFKPFIYKMMILPRQARDKHRENSKNNAVFRT
jgi:hypothetical protein